MSSSQTTNLTASSSDSDPADVRKRKRMISNRESARRSRMRKQQHLEKLIGEASQLQAENARLATQIEAVAWQLAEAESGNTVLRTQLVELTDRLRSVNSLLLFLEDFSGVAMDIPEIPQPLLEPWQLPCPAPAVLASHDALHQY